jgi:hypothetical protein
MTNSKRRFYVAELREDAYVAARFCQKKNFSNYSGAILANAGIIGDG